MISISKHGPVTSLTMSSEASRALNLDVNCYYVDGLLIDSGPRSVAADIPRAFENVSVDTLVNTHSHEDHVGNNSYFIANKNCNWAWAHELAIPIIEQEPEFYTPAPYYRLDVHKEPAKSSAKPITEEVLTNNYRFEIIHTPGHTPDHIVLLEPDHGWLFTGDLFLAVKNTLILLGEDPQASLDSLKQVARQDFEKLFCCSGLILEKEAKNAFNAKIDYLENLRFQALKLFESGHAPESIRDQLLGEESFFYDLTGGGFSKLNTINGFIKSKYPLLATTEYKSSKTLP